MPRRKALKVIVDIHLHAITCPGVFLPDQNDVFVYVELLGQRKRTQSMPPVFPFLFHEKIRFDKVFTHCTDPVQIASALTGESVRIELVQLTYPAGELLATYEDNAREFLFPTPRASPSYPGVDREVLLRRCSSFNGIAPKLEFSSRTVIKEVTSTSGSSHSLRKKEKSRYDCELSSNKQLENPPIVSSTPHPSNSRPSTSKKKPKSSQSSALRNGRKARSASLNRATTQWGYEQSTISSRARSPSPYTKRRMAQLSIKDPFDSAIKSRPFKTELEERPEFVVRKATRDCLSFSKSPPSLPCLSPGSERQRSPHRRSSSPSRRKQTPGPSKYCHTADFESDDGRYGSSADEIYSYRPPTVLPDEAERFRRWRSTYYRPIKSPCCLERPIARSSRDEHPGEPLVRERDLVKCERDIYQPRDRSSVAPLSRHDSFPAMTRRGRERVRRSPTRVTFKNTTEFIGGSNVRQRRSGSGSRPSSARSAPESTPRPVTPRRDLSFSRADLEPESLGTRSRADPDSILFRRPLRERFSTGEPSPYEKIRDRVRDLLSSPRANRILDDSAAEANERYWRRRSCSPSPRVSPRCAVSVPLGNGDYWSERSSDLLGKSHRRCFEENMDKIYDGIYSNLKSDS